MVSQEEFIKHYNCLYDSKAVYVWGASCEKITREFAEKLYKDFGSGTYNKKYYDSKYAEGHGRTGADCAGSAYPLSKSCSTVRGYYLSCVKKGAVSAIPTGTACLVFDNAFTHMGAYLGNGVTIEMKNSRENCVRQAFNASRWGYYGIPPWLGTEGSKNSVPVTMDCAVMKNVQEWCNKKYNAGIATDGRCGRQTVEALCKALQCCLNSFFGAELAIDGIFGEKTQEACVSARKHKDLTYIAQALLYVKGYDMSCSIKDNNFDSEYKNNMEAMVAMFQADTRGLKQDSKCKGATFKKLFAWN